MVASKSSRLPSNFGTQGSGLYAIGGGRKYLNAAERQRALGALTALSQRQALFVMMLAWTGARISELLALDHASFQVEQGVVAFATLKRRRHVVREVPLPPDLMAALDREFGLSDMQRDLGLAVRRLWPWHRVTAWRMVKGLMATSGINGAPACPRGFRHGFGVGAVQAGVPLNLVQRWLGHARLSTTAIYTEASGPEEQVFAARLWQQFPSR